MKYQVIHFHEYGESPFIVDDPNGLMDQPDPDGRIRDTLVVLLDIDFEPDRFESLSWYQIDGHEVVLERLLPVAESKEDAE